MIVDFLVIELFEKNGSTIDIMIKVVRRAFMKSFFLSFPSYLHPDWTMVLYQMYL